MKKVLIEDLKYLACELENNLKKLNVNCAITPYFAYGAYSYYFDIYDRETKKQLKTQLCTKKECYYYMYEVYYKIINNLDYYIERSFEYEK